MRILQSFPVQVNIIVKRDNFVSDSLVNWLTENM